MIRDWPAQETIQSCVFKGIYTYVKLNYPPIAFNPYSKICPSYFARIRFHALGWQTTIFSKEKVGDEKVDRAKELIVEDARALAPEINKTFSLGQ